MSVNLGGSSSSGSGGADIPQMNVGLHSLIIHYSSRPDITLELKYMLVTNEILDCETLSCLTDKDCKDLSASITAEAVLVFDEVRVGSSKNKNGLIATMDIRNKVKAISAQYPAPIAPQVSSPTVSLKASNSIVAVTNRISFGTNKDLDAPPLAVPILELIEANMDLAALTCHEIIMHYVPAAGRLQEIAVGGKEFLNLQLEIYKFGTKSSVTLGERARRAKSFFESCVMRGWNPLIITEWQAAAWVQACSAKNTKTARRTAIGTLSFLERVLGVSFHAKSALVASQGSRGKASKSCEPPVPAVPPAFNVVATLEVLISTAPTRVERVLCGFFCCLAYSCLRCSDLLTTRNLHMTKDSIAGQSLMKTSKVWTQWYAPRMGISGMDWASEWMQQLCLAKLPGKDYIITGFNGQLDRWLPRRANHKDIAQALQAILVTVASVPVEIASSLTPPPTHSGTSWLDQGGSYRFRGR